jgi:hypothetical protein
MEKRTVFLALALTLPLALYGVPYAYASVSSSDHVVRSTLTVSGGGVNNVNVLCPSGDYAVSGGYRTAGTGVSSSGVQAFPDIVSTFPTSGGVPTTTGETPDGWRFDAGNSALNEHAADVWVVCQTPITVGGIGVPEFGSIYVAIALAALVYFMLARHFTRKPLTTIASA